MPLCDDGVMVSRRARDLYLRDGEDIHANRGETSILMHLRPEMVRPEKTEDVSDITPAGFSPRDASDHTKRRRWTSFGSNG
ncbi:creatininase family protein [Mesorhizobium sp. YC-39]|uniref:creatininase family protein n=1 Tax=unclassified Mesorhizobium TaxID=325217 RepID=UPI0021E71B99|nr:MULTISPECIES: creatininase family protein [unclassified Mesorhizobium]MCV3205611.1 creatininase family protein [Mesorhizobium sp. YC-2]MCV3227990.1 creatininase family protein [Mesorhizobium sp. YC-39]